MDTGVGAPVPDNLEAMSIAELHKLHYNYDLEHVAVRAKQLAVKDALSTKYAARNLANRASFDLVLKMPESLTLDEAKASLSMVAKGIMNAPADWLRKVQDIVERMGK